MVSEKQIVTEITTEKSEEEGNNLKEKIKEELVKIDIKIEDLLNTLRNFSFIKNIKVEKKRVKVIFKKEERIDSSTKIIVMRLKEELEELLDKKEKLRKLLKGYNTEEKSTKKIEGDLPKNTKEILKTIEKIKKDKEKEAILLNEKRKAKVNKELQTGITKTSYTFKKNINKTTPTSWVSFFTSLSFKLVLFIIIYIYFMPIFNNFIVYIVSLFLSIIEGTFNSLGLSLSSNIFKSFSLVFFFMKSLTSFLIMLFFVEIFKLVVTTIKKEKLKVLWELKREEEQ